MLHQEKSVHYIWMFFCVSGDSVDLSLFLPGIPCKQLRSSPVFGDIFFHESGFKVISNY